MFPTRDLPDAAPDAVGPTRKSSSFLSGVLAAGLAAAIVAVLSSFAGLQGTVVGAMLGAMVTSASNQIMKARLDVIEQRLIGVGFSAWRLRRQGTLRAILATPGAPLMLLRAIPSAAFRKVGALALAGFVFGMFAITLVEAAQGRPLSAAGSDESRSGTTVGTIAAPVVRQAEHVIEARPTSTPAPPTAIAPAVAPSPANGASAATPGPTATVPATAEPRLGAPATAPTGQTSATATARVADVKPTSPGATATANAHPTLAPTAAPTATLAPAAPTRPTGPTSAPMASSSPEAVPTLRR